MVSCLGTCIRAYLEINHLWRTSRNNLPLQITAIVSLSVTIAMYCLLSMYISVSSELSDKRPVLKLISIKAVGALPSVDDSLSLYLTHPLNLVASILDILAGFVLVSLIDVWRRKRRMHLAVSPVRKITLT